MTSYFMSITEDYAHGGVRLRVVNFGLFDRKIREGRRVQIARMLSMDALIVGVYYTSGSGLPHDHLFHIGTDISPTKKLVDLTMARLSAGGQTQHDN